MLVYRPPAPAEAPLDVLPVAKEMTTVMISPPEATPPAPKHLSERAKRQRFTWESPEMYVEDE